MDAKFSFAQALIREAGDFVRERMAQDRQVEIKSGPADLVTDLDKATQDFLIARIREAYPQAKFLAEENQLPHPEEAEEVWVIDPIDGTVNFLAMGADFAIILAYLEKGEGQFGLIYDVMADQLYAGGGRYPVTCNGDAQPFSKPAKALNQSLVACNTRLFKDNDSGIADFLQSSLGIRNYGCAGLSMVKVLKGQLWGYVSYLCPWDYLAAQIMGKALGYELVTLDGQEPNRRDRQKVLFYPQAASQEVLAFLGQ